MSFGVIMLVHTNFDRVERLARHWAAGGCPVVIHVDSVVPKHKFSDLRAALSDKPQILFSKRHRCEWGTWAMVAATLDASELMLDSFPDIGHVYLASGSCLPLRPVADLRAFLQSHSETDFIESVCTGEVAWAMCGLNHERFTLRFPFSWKRNRRLFDWYVNFQRRWKMRRRLPDGLVPHMGSQWWCLTRWTLQAILKDQRRPVYDTYFRRVWIPDESYFQSLARHHTRRIQSRSLTLAKFDFQGKPHVFYDDHLALLRRSDCFVARKIWPKADLLFEAFLTDPIREGEARDAQPSQIARRFSRARTTRAQGRVGLRMQSRFPHPGSENRLTAAPYTVFEGFSELFVDFESWLADATGTTVHGHLFDPNGVAFANGAEYGPGGLSNSAVLRDYDALGFLRSLIWNARSSRQCFMYGPRDTRIIGNILSTDSSARINVISGAWIIPLFRAGGRLGPLRTKAAHLQNIEEAHLNALRDLSCRARVQIWTLAEFLEDPFETLTPLIDKTRAPDHPKSVCAPLIVDLRGLGNFLQRLRDGGMDPYLCGEFGFDLEEVARRAQRQLPHVVGGDR